MNASSTERDEARWRRLADAQAAEESLSESEREFLEDFVPRSPEGRAEAQLFRALAALGDQEPGAGESPSPRP